MTEKSSNVVWHRASVTRAHREKRNRHKSLVLWFTGLSASGKSILAHAVEQRLCDLGCNTFVLDGDNVRHGLCSNPGFSLEDREENLRRVGEVAKLIVESGVLVLTAFISPLRRNRERVRSLFPHGDFLEVFCNASLEVCESRDPKGMYRRARQGQIPEFTGISSPYEAPVNPELCCDTGLQSLNESVDEVLELLSARGILPSK